jgi:hypothetical protein
MRPSDRFEEIKRRFGVAELRALFDDAGLVMRGSGRNRARCPRCQDSPREVSISEDAGTGLWHCFHCGAGGSAIDLLSLSRGISAAEALAELERVVGIDPSPATLPPPPRRAAPAPERPPLDEVDAVWALCRPLSDVPEVMATWVARGIDVARVEEHDLARVLRTGAPLPPWACGSGWSWSEGPCRLILPLYDALGRLVSLHARAARAPHQKPKGLSPRGYAVGGLVLGDALARLMLSGGLLCDDTPASELVRRLGLLVAEGVPDFLTAATLRSDADQTAPAVIGLIAGSWTEAIAARVPDGAPVLIAVHEDPAGSGYSARIAGALEGRCEMRRFGAGSAA